MTPESQIMELEDTALLRNGSVDTFPRQRMHKQKRTPWPESASELYQPSDCRLSAKLVPNFADTVCHLVSVTDPYGRNFNFLDRTNAHAAIFFGNPILFAICTSAFSILCKNVYRGM
jgi:hypothetical protein